MLLSSSNRKYPPFPLLSYFFRGCVPEIFVTSYSVTYCIYVPGKPGICFHYYVQFMMSANIRIRFGLQIVLVCLYSTPSHYHHCANLSEGIELVKRLSDIFLSSVWVRLRIFSPLSIIQYVGLYVFSLPISLVMIKIIYILCLSIIIKSEVWTIYPLFRVRSWHNGVHCMSFYILLLY